MFKIMMVNLSKMSRMRHMSERAWLCENNVESRVVSHSYEFRSDGGFCSEDTRGDVLGKESAPIAGICALSQKPLYMKSTM